MATVTDEDVLELVERFDVDIEDTTTIDKLQAALGDKLAAAGVPYVSKDFQDRFREGLELKYESLPEIGVRFRYYQMPSTKNYPGGYWQGIFSDEKTGRRISFIELGKRLYP